LTARNTPDQIAEAQKLARGSGWRSMRRNDGGSVL